MKDNDMAKIVSYPAINSLDYAVYDEKRYVSLRKRTFRNVTVPEGFVFDGVSVPWFVMWMFTHNELKRGMRASCFHDFLCENRGQCKRKEATSILLKLWKEDGLGKRWYTSWKPWIVYIFVELYQMKQGGWKK